MASIESMVSGLIVGVTYGFFSGQPLTILGSTGPILVFETIMYDFCKVLPTKIFAEIIHDVFKY